MSKYRHQLPQLGGDIFLTDGGLETTLIFHKGIDLPYFAAFTLLEYSEGREQLRDYFRDYVSLARQHHTGFVLEAPTWRANPDWLQKLNYPASAVRDVNYKAIEFLEDIRDIYETPDTPMVLSGCIGPRGDGYSPSNLMTVSEAETYHRPQIEAFVEAGADLVSAITMNYVEEAIGITRAARNAGIPVVISFTVETDGRLPTGQSLGEAINAVDAATDGTPVYYMLNCAHPTHFITSLPENEAWVRRLRGLRANASCKSHAELDQSTELDAGDPEELGLQYRAIRDRLPRITVLGGCCGTDHRHVGAICRSCVPVSIS